MKIRKPIVAGIFYPDDYDLLKNQIESYLLNVKETPLITPKAIIVPHAGYLYSGQVAGYGFKLLEKNQYKNVILLGPSHQFYFQKFCFCPVDYFETPLGKVLVTSLENLLDSFKLKSALKEICFFSEEIHQEEHSLEVQLPFLQVVLKDFKIIPILISSLPSEKNIEDMIIILEEFLKKENNLLIVSTDLSHYYPYEKAILKDKKTISYILEKNEKKLKEEGEACGLNALILCLKLANKINLKPILLKYLNSGDITKDYNQVVGYTAIAFN